MKKFKTISLLAMGAAAISIYAADFLYFHRNGEVQSPRASAILAKMFEKLGFWSREIEFFSRPSV